MRVRSALLALALAMTASTAAQAQDEEVTLGDRVRVSTEGDGVWTEGRLTEVEGDTLSLAKGVQELHYRLGEIHEAERWDARDPALLLLGSTVGGAVGFWASGAIGGDTDACEFDGADCPHLTGSGAGDAAVGAGLGLVGGLVIWALDPGDWTAWEVPVP